MSRKKVIYFLIALVIIAGVFFALIKKYNTDAVEPLADQTTATTTANIILFYRPDCPHCQVVEEYLVSNQVADKVDFSRKDVSLYQENVELFLDKATICKLPQASLGVPFLWTGSSCLIGSDDIINFFKAKISN